MRRLSSVDFFLSDSSSDVIVKAVAGSKAAAEAAVGVAEGRPVKAAGIGAAKGGITIGMIGTAVGGTAVGIAGTAVGIVGTAVGRPAVGIAGTAVGGPAICIVGAAEGETAVGIVRVSV